MTAQTKPLIVSPIVPTMGRAEEIRPLLESFMRQTRKADEILVVDQNEDDRLVPILAEFPDLPIRHIHDPALRGMNKSRNHGWRESEGDVIFFPDDDCYYPDDFIEKVLAKLEETGADVLTGRSAQGKGRYAEVAGWVDRNSVWTTQIEWVLIPRRAVLETTGGFDETIGPGAGGPWGACEAQDFSLKALSMGFREYYDPNLQGHHPPFDFSAMDASIRARIAGYSRGMGFVLARHGYGWMDAGYHVTRALGTIAKAALKGDRAKMQYGWAVFKGRLSGYLRARREVERYQPPV